MISTGKRSRCWFFTYNYKDEKSRAQFLVLLKNGDFKYVVQDEKGENGTCHLQGVIRYTNPRLYWPDNFDKTVHWERCRHWGKAKKYCTKLDTRIGGPWSNVEGLTWRKSIINKIDSVELYGWQKDILKLVEQPLEFRKVYWYWSMQGQMGKTSFIRHLRIKYGNRCMYFNGAKKDILYAFGIAIEKHDVDICCFGLTRSDMNCCSYKSLEILKDGIAFSTKYESGDMVFNPPHVIVIANWPPDTSRLSKDRWVVTNVDA